MHGYDNEGKIDEPFDHQGDLRRLKVIKEAFDGEAMILRTFDTVTTPEHGNRQHVVAHLRGLDISEQSLRRVLLTNRFRERREIGR